jgi:hypothetical protein
VTANNAHVGPRTKPRVRWYWWPLWLVLLAIGLLVFYVVFTPAWIGIRLTAWLSEHVRRPRRNSRDGQ